MFYFTYSPLRSIAGFSLPISDGRGQLGGVSRVTARGRGLLGGGVSFHGFEPALLLVVLAEEGDGVLDSVAFFERLLLGGRALVSLARLSLGGEIVGLVVLVLSPPFLAI